MGLYVNSTSFRVCVDAFHPLGPERRLHWQASSGLACCICHTSDALDGLAQTCAVQSRPPCLCRDSDKVSGRVNRVLNLVAQLELLQAPGLPYSIPKEFDGLPRLTGGQCSSLHCVQEGWLGGAWLRESMYRTGLSGCP